MWLGGGLWHTPVSLARTFLACLPLVSTESKAGHEAVSLSGMLLAFSAKDRNQNCSFSRSSSLSISIISIFCYHCHFLGLKRRVVIQSSTHGKIKHLEKVTITKIPSLEDNSLVECSYNFLSYNAYTCKKNDIKEPATLALVQRTTHEWFTYNSASTFEAKLEGFASTR